MDRGTSIAHVHEVLAIEDRVLRNYWVTQTYSDLANAISRVLGPDTANWCTFATWASCTVGQNLRGEDLPKWLHTRIVLNDGMMGALHVVNEDRGNGFLSLMNELTPDHLFDVVRELFGACATNLSDGNTEVFAEIAPAAATFLECYAGDPPDRETARTRVLDACGTLEFDGINRLRAGFSMWCDAMDEADPRRKSQLILAGSLQLGAHEQNHLQDAIAGSIDMGMNQSIGRLSQRLGTSRGIAELAERLAGVLDPLGEAVADLWGDMMTELLGTIQTPDGTLQLTDDVPLLPDQAFLPDDLDPVVVDDLARLLQKFDHSRGDGVGSAANNWVDLAERMNFIANLFCSRHHRMELFEPPFATDVLAEVEADRIPRMADAEIGFDADVHRQPPTVGLAQFTEGFLEGLRAAGDGPADDAVAEFFDATHVEHAELFRGLARAQKIQDAEDEDLPGVSRFVNELEGWPEWADPRLVAEGQRVFGKWGPQLGMALWMASLPANYACARGAEPLVRTARLTRNPKRRYVETGQMIIDAMTPGALVPGHSGYRTVRHVRLMHAAVRHVLLHADEIEGAREAGIEPWDHSIGVPINQEDLLGCLLSFSVVGIESLDRSGARLSSDEREAYVHVWNLVGHQLGIADGLLPLDWADSKLLWERVKKLEYAASDAGRELTGAAIDCIQDLMGTDDLMGMSVFRGLPASGVRHYLGNETADLLGVPPADWTRWFFTFIVATDAFYDRAAAIVPGRGWLTAELGRRMLRGFEQCERGGDRPAFEISDELREAWGMNVNLNPLSASRRTLQRLASTPGALVRRLPTPPTPWRSSGR